MKATLHLGGEFDLDVTTYEEAMKQIRNVSEACGYWVETAKVENDNVVEVADRWDEWQFRLVFKDGTLYAVTDMKTKKVHHIAPDGMIEDMEYWFEGKRCHRWGFEKYSCGYCGEEHKTMDLAEECYVKCKAKSEDREKNFVPKVDDGKAEEVLALLKDASKWKPVNLKGTWSKDIAITYGTDKYYGVNVTLYKSELKKELGIVRITNKVISEYIKNNYTSILVNWLKDFDKFEVKFNPDSGRTDYEWDYNCMVSGPGFNSCMAGYSVCFGVSKYKTKV